MAKSKDTCIVEIPVDQEHQKLLSCMTNNIAEAIEDHPLTEISESPGHLLLLKLWQREENLSAKRISLKESRMFSTRSELFTLSTSFFIFHALFLTLLFTSWAKAQQIQAQTQAQNNTNTNTNTNTTCGKWWVPSMVSLCTSIVFMVLVQLKVNKYWRVWDQLQWEKGDGRNVNRCIVELRMKGASFDLSKEPQKNYGNGKKRMKSSSVEIKWKPVTWCSRNLITICLVCFTGFVFPASKIVLCWL